MTTAKNILSKILAGMILAGYEDGEYIWIGTINQWQAAGRLEELMTEYESYSQSSY